MPDAEKKETQSTAHGDTGPGWTETLLSLLPLSRPPIAIAGLSERPPLVKDSTWTH